MSEQEAATATDSTDDAPVDEVEPTETSPEPSAEAPADDASGEEELTPQQALAPASRPPSVNDVVPGVVARLVDFGAFVDISSGPEGGTVTGLVHVSEVDAGFVENIYAHLAEGEVVQVRVLSIGDDGKIGLSIKQADPNWDDFSEADRPRRSTIDKDFDRRLRKFMHNSQSIQGEARRQRRSRLGNQKPR